MAIIKTIAEHSVAVDLLTGGICIDVGCRGFQFSSAMKDLGCEVHAYDIEDMDAPEGISYNKLAILDREGIAYFKDTKDQQAKYITEWGIEVECTHINTLLKKFSGDKEIDVLKLDCESSEYIILTAWDYQILPRQLTIEFHEHAHKHLHDLFFDKCIENLNKHYVPIKHDRYAAHGAGMNYWDSLWIRRDLL